ncbi:hypothetical protein LX97_00052 [Nonlabens dokdonensis]|uniref:Outer membrane protein beta-barrel domain-containing protein n=2 Tax=Nonlabens dokdonensis TaxID=328515 RepID=L7W928_NONDD|nr:hypothetical protein [Nonlabens dokdonensis]AGC75348.1 hypothetical protein DDD_0221 [Nonlabens dokdonensis DSW-6]PZX43053.1 hypothetical protein LX97_00052 [Nonlabens dokdonensis]
MRKLFVSTVALLFLNFLNAQDLFACKHQKDSLPSQTSSFENPYVKIGIGYWLPKGDLSNFIDNSPLFELAFVIPESKKNRSFEIGVQLGVPEQRRFFILQDNGNTFDIEATSIVNGFIKLNKYVVQKPKGRLGLGISLGIAAIFVDPVESSGAQALDYDSINSVLVAPGLTYDVTLKDNSMFQFSFDVQYTPFKMERAVTKDLSSFTLLPKLSYRF